jgi:hypothetical protein
MLKDNTMNKRPMIGLSRKELTLRIVAGDPLALAEGEIRNLSRMRKGKATVKAYDSLPLPLPLPLRRLRRLPMPSRRSSPGQ